MLDLKREWFKSEERLIGRTLGKLPITPNQWTCLSVVFALVGLYFTINLSFVLAFVMFFFAGILDFVDGSVARAKNMSSKTGAYIDTVVDRYVEGIMLFGLLFVTLPEILIPAYAWVFLAIFGSIVTTYAKAAAKEKDLVNQELKGGLMSRGERIILIFAMFILLAFSQAYIATIILIVIAVLSNFTALQRFFSAINLNKKDIK
ncbi:MAG: CDP-alcohol phosphatidyltransferase family protein [Candidatus Pacebacteria bacterium]|nr:CDP-alcohol phosphatidyltransferase family protein [Candidatus Paceibacterota bacterium]MDD3918983.1 CDP-alcohol phosphatidyltransferase family protein [Candidatus Paceibacterota bacterium]